MILTSGQLLVVPPLIGLAVVSAQSTCKYYNVRLQNGMEHEPEAAEQLFPGLRLVKQISTNYFQYCRETDDDDDVTDEYVESDGCASESCYSVRDPHADDVLGRFIKTRRAHDLGHVLPLSEESRRIHECIGAVDRDVPRQLFKRSLQLSPRAPFEPEAKRYGRKYDALAAIRPLDRSVIEELGLLDPLFHNQWHLYNEKQVGRDLNVLPVWQRGITGENVTVAIIDDGIDFRSPDIAPNYSPRGSYDFNNHRAEPIPELADDFHGTRCAGEIAAARNNVCGVGVAYNAKVAGIRVLSGQLSNADEAAALVYNNQDTQIYSCSWGPPDDGQSVDGPPPPVKQAMIDGIHHGRGGLGSIFVFASGNGGKNDDDCNYDGYTNSPYTLTVSAINRDDMHAAYSEICSANLISTYSNGLGYGIVSSGVFYGKMYQCIWLTEPIVS